MNAIRRTLALLALLLAAAPAVAQTPRILVLGDSWAEGSHPRFAPMLFARGHGDKSAVPLAIAGLTASALDTPSGRQQISDVLAANPTVDVVHLSIGGNDLLGGWSTGLDAAAEAARFAAIRDDVASITDHVLAQRPDLQVVIASYDYPNFFDTVLADPFGSAAAIWALMGQPTPGQLNRAFFGDQQCQGNGATDGLEDLRAQVADVRSRVHHSDFEGRMQIAAQGFCHLDFPTPTSFMADGGADPIHPTDAGYDLYVNRAFDSVYAGLFAGPVLATIPAPGGVLDFGPVRVGDVAQRDATATNAGPLGSRLQASFSAAAGGFSGGGNTFHLFVEQATSTGDTGVETYSYAPASRGPAAAVGGISSSAGGAFFTLLGRGVGPVVDADPALAFGGAFFGAPVSRTVEIRNTSDDVTGDPALTDLTLVSATVTGADANAFHLPTFVPGTHVAAGGAVAVEVAFDAPAEGPRTATLMVQTDDGAAFEALGAVVEIPLSGTSVACGLGLELSVLLPALAWMRRRRTR